MKLNLFLICLVTFNIFSIEYDSVHDSTYWFYEEELQTGGYYIGAVRSNVVYSDKLRFVISKEDCNQIPGMYLTLSSYQTPEIKKENKDFDIKKMEDQKITFKVYIDEYEPFLIDATINIADDLNSASSMFFIEFDNGMPRNFISLKKNDSDSLVEVMMLEIQKNDPNYKYFDITQIKFRMGGLVNVWMHAHQLCLDDTRIK